MTGGPKPRRIGFVGLGNMGWPMAANLVAAGYELTVYDSNIGVRDEFVTRHRAIGASCLAQLARTVECTITMRPDHHAVRAVVLDATEDGMGAALEPGHVVVDMSTSDPTATRSLGAALSLRSVHLIDAPVMGGVVFARDRTLDIMAGGDGEILERLQPVFAALGRQVFHCGPLGSGHAMKVINNYINAAALMSLVEGLTMGRKLGIDTQMMVESMQAMCTGRNHPLEKKVIPHVLTGRHASGMSLGFIGKDLAIAVDAAERAGASTPLARHVRDLWQGAAQALGPERDQTELVRYWERASDVNLR